MEKLSDKERYFPCLFRQINAGGRDLASDLNAKAEPTESEMGAPAAKTVTGDKAIATNGLGTYISVALHFSVLGDNLCSIEDTKDIYAGLAWMLAQDCTADLKGFTDPVRYHTFLLSMDNKNGWWITPLLALAAHNSSLLHPWLGRCILMWPRGIINWDLLALVKFEPL